MREEAQIRAYLKVVDGLCRELRVCACELGVRAERSSETSEALEHLRTNDFV